VERELNNYTVHIPLLEIGRFPAFIQKVAAGAGESAGIFYQFGTDFELLTNILHCDPDRAALIARKLQHAERNWTHGAPQSTLSVKEIRRFLVSDEGVFAVSGHLAGIGWEAFERRTAQAVICSQHGDLHCGNVLIGPHDEPIFIDFASLGNSPASLDPITLEFSTVFHPGSRLGSAAWPTVAQAEQWYDIDAFAVSSPFEAFLRATWDWALAVSAGKREILAVGYAFAIRQLKYQDTDKELARAIIRASITAFEQT
jgi:hypothetical protein